MNPDAPARNDEREVGPIAGLICILYALAVMMLA